jgi:rifampin ADP-ribosylating transferase
MLQSRSSSIVRKTRGRNVSDQQDSAASKSIAESIAESANTAYVPVTYGNYGHVAGPFFHGTGTSFEVGALLIAGQPSNYQAGRVSNNVYFSALLEPAIWAAELAIAFAKTDGDGRVYIVEPTGPFEDDPNVTNKKFSGNVTRSYRTRHPLRVVEEVQSWVGHPPEVLQAMLDNITRLRDQGLDVIED